MNAKILLTLALVASAAANVVLVTRKPAATAPAVAPAATASAAPEKSPEKPAASPTGTTLIGGTNKPAQSFDWRAVESADYKQYIANLRSIGCPEETIRDIITADVNKLFESRKKALSAAGGKTNKFEYWKPGMQMFTQMFDEEKIKQQQALAKEKRALLTELLGVAPEEKPDMTAMMGGGAQMMEQMLDFISPSKQAQVMEVEQKFAAKLMKAVGNGADADSLKDMAKVQKEKEAELAKVLTPQELEDYNLRMSQTAMMMRFQLASFEPNEQEFKDIFKAKKKFEDEFGMGSSANYGYPGGGTQEEKDKYAAAKKELTAELKAAVGEARYAEYERAQDFTYQSLYSITQKQGLAKDVAVQVYDMKTASETQAKQVRADKSLSSEQRTTALQAIRDETEQAVKTALGDKAFQSFQKNQGANWINRISPAKK